MKTNSVYNIQNNFIRQIAAMMCLPLVLLLLFCCTMLDSLIEWFADATEIVGDFKVCMVVRPVDKGALLQNDKNLKPASTEAK